MLAAVQAIERCVKIGRLAAVLEPTKMAQTDKGYVCLRGLTFNLPPKCASPAQFFLPSRVLVARGKISIGTIQCQRIG